MREGVQNFTRFSALLLTCTGLFAQTKLSPDLRNVDLRSTVRVNVRYRNVDSTKAAKARGNGASHFQSQDAVKTATVVLPARGLAALSKDPDVESISLDRPLRASLDYTPETVSSHIAEQYGFDGRGIAVAIIDSGIRNSKDFNDPVTGKSRIVYNESFVPCPDAITSAPSVSQPVETMTSVSTSTTDSSGTTSSTTTTSSSSSSSCSSQKSAVDAFGHGTHVAGIIGGAGQNSSGPGYTHRIRGIAPRANIVNLRALDEQGRGYDQSVIAAINRAIELKNIYNIRVMNLSLGRPVSESYLTDPLAQAVKAAWDAGIVVVCAAGNRGRDNSMGTQGYGTISTPGNSPWVITVGAMKTQNNPTRADDTMATFSSKGPTVLDHVVKPDLVAPGNRVDAVQCSTCTLTTSYPANRTLLSSYRRNGTGPSADYFSLSGTSMATPAVSGAALLLLQKDPTLTAAQVKARLMKTASKTFPTMTTSVDNGVIYTVYYDIFTVGAGYLDVWAALNNTDRATGPATSPIAKVDPVTKKVYLVQANNVIWGDNVIWGNNVIWGDRLMSGSNVIWGDSLPWSGMAANNVIWGENVIWGDSLTSLNFTIFGEN